MRIKQKTQNLIKYNRHMAVNRYVVVKLLRGEKLFDKFVIRKYKIGKMNITAI